MTHWIWAICLFFLLLSGLQIFNAHPQLYIGKQSGFEFQQRRASPSAPRTPTTGPRGYTEIFGPTLRHHRRARLSGPAGQADVTRLPGLGDDPVLP